MNYGALESVDLHVCSTQIYHSCVDKKKFIKYLSMCKTFIDVMLGKLKGSQNMVSLQSTLFCNVDSISNRESNLLISGSATLRKMHECKFSYLGICIRTPKGSGETVGTLVQIEVMFHYIAQSPPACL